MGCFPDRVCGDPKTYVSRCRFGDYLEALVRPPTRCGCAQSRPWPVYRGVSETAEGVMVRLADGSEIAADFTILATGNEELSAEAESGWSRAAPPVPEAVVLIKGAGLAMVDRVISLAAAGRHGPIFAVSCHGVRPRPHAVPAPVTGMS